MLHENRGDVAKDVTLAELNYHYSTVWHQCIFIEWIYVAPVYRRCGLGTYLLCSLRRMPEHADFCIRGVIKTYEEESANSALAFWCSVGSNDSILKRQQRRSILHGDHEDVWIADICILADARAGSHVPGQTKLKFEAHGHIR